MSNAAELLAAKRAMKRMLLPILAAGAMLATVQQCSKPAIAQGISPCGPTAAILQSLYSEHGEVPVFVGRSQRGYVVIVTAAHDRGSFSVVAVDAVEPKACFLDAGEEADVKALPAEKPKKPGQQS